MEEDLSKKVQARFAELPIDVRQAVAATDLDARIQAIGARHRLHLDQMGTLQGETLLVMLGFNDPSAFVDSLVTHLNLNRDQATAIGTDINNEIFAPIRESLKKLSTPETTASTPPTPAAVTQPAPKPTPPTAPAPVPVAPKPAPPTTTKPTVPLAPHPHDLMLVEKTVTTPPTAPQTPAAPTPSAAPAVPTPPKPNSYKADPYREPPIP